MEFYQISANAPSEHRSEFPCSSDLRGIKCDTLFCPHMNDIVAIIAAHTQDALILHLNLKYNIVIVDFWKTIPCVCLLEKLKPHLCMWIVSNLNHVNTGIGYESRKRWLKEAVKILDIGKISELGIKSYSPVCRHFCPWWNNGVAMMRRKWSLILLWVQGEAVGINKSTTDGSITTSKVPREAAWWHPSFLFPGYPWTQSHCLWSTYSVV